MSLHCSHRRHHHGTDPGHARAAPRAGLTLLELLIAISIMVIVVGTLSALAKAVQSGAEYSDGHAAATQHARVVVERISRTVNGATANESFPGFRVVAARIDDWYFPDTLVVWHPDGAPADPQGLPRFNELVIYCPAPGEPNRLLEVTAPTDMRTVPPFDDDAGWAAETAALKNSSASRRVTLTDLLRTAVVPEALDGGPRGAVRFEWRLRPSSGEWADYRSGTLTWDQLSWVQGIYGSQVGLRQAWVRIELQLMPAETAASRDISSQEAVPFLGSAAVYYQMSR